MLKNWIRKIPVVSGCIQWVWDLATISRSKKWTGEILSELSDLNKELNQRLQHDLAAANQRIDSLKEELRTEIYRIGRSQQYRIDQFLFEAEQHRNTGSAEPGAVADAVGTLDPFYLAFEDRFRGSREVILERCREYLPLLAPLRERTSPVALDLGCGRGEWLQTLASAGFEARGIDMGGAMVASCTEAGLDVRKLSAHDALRALPDASLDLVSAFHLIEHLSWNELYTLVSEILRTLKPGGMLLLETPNAQNLLVASQTFYKDPTHRNPVHPDTLKFLMEYHGAADVVIHPLHPFPESMHLPQRSETEHFLNGWIYGPQDYLAVGIKGI